MILVVEPHQWWISPMVLVTEPHQWWISPMVLMAEPHQGCLLSPTELIATILLPRNLAATKQQLTGGKAEASTDSQSWGSRIAILYLSRLSHYRGSLCIGHTDPTSNTQVLNLSEVWCAPFKKIAEVIWTMCIQHCHLHGICEWWHRLWPLP